MEWRQGSFIHQYYKNNENLLTRSLEDDIQIFMVQNFEGILEWYDSIFILELKFKLLNERKINRHLSEDEIFRQGEKIVNDIVKEYDSTLRYRIVDRVVSRTIERHKDKWTYYTGYGFNGYIV